MEEADYFNKWPDFDFKITTRNGRFPRDVEMFEAIAGMWREVGFRGRGGRPFASFTLQRVLINEALAGTLVYGKRPRKGNPPSELVRVPDFFAAILSDKEWQRLQGRLSIRRESSRGRTHSSEYLLSGIARCGQCGGPITGKKAATY